jgi:hypothetical protein
MLVVAMVCCWAFTSCGDDKDNDEPQNPLFGAWEYVHNPQVAAALEQMIVQKLQEDQALTPENIQLLTKVKEIVSTSEFIVLIQPDGEARLYSYTNKGIGVFVSGSWLQTDKALILQASNLTLAVTDVQLDGNKLTCKIGELPLAFTKIKANIP